MPTFTQKAVRESDLALGGVQKKYSTGGCGRGFRHRSLRIYIGKLTCIRCIQPPPPSCPLLFCTTSWYNIASPCAEPDRQEIYNETVQQEKTLDALGDALGEMKRMGQVRKLSFTLLSIEKCEPAAHLAGKSPESYFRSQEGGGHSGIVGSDKFPCLSFERRGAKCMCVMGEGGGLPLLSSDNIAIATNVDAPS